MLNYNVPLEGRMYSKDSWNALSYVPPDSYLKRFLADRKDVTKFIPHQRMKKFPRNGNEGLYGWTYKNKDGAIRVREDLIGMMKLETDIHESIHTPDEYETRVVTRWIMEGIFVSHQRYSKKKEYFR